MIRKAVREDVPVVAQIYEQIHDEVEKGVSKVGWVRGVYPTPGTAQRAFEKGELYVAEQDGRVVASAIINHEQVDCYKGVAWKHECEDSRVLVMHTLSVSTDFLRQGIAGKFLEFYEELAAQTGCLELRIDTQEQNQIAREMYKKFGYEEIGTVPCMFNGIMDVRLVLLEKSLG